METKRNFAAFLVKGLEKHSRIKTLEQNHLPLEAHMENKQVLKSSINSCLHDCKQVMGVEAILLEDLIKPMILFTKYFLPFKNTFKYDPVAKRIFWVNGSFTRKVCARDMELCSSMSLTLCILWEVIVVNRLGMKLILSLEKSAVPSGSSSPITAGAYTIFLLFNLAWFHIYWMRTENYCDILNHTLSLAGAIHLKNRSPPRIKVIRYGVHVSWIYTTLYVIMTLAVYMIQVYSPQVLDLNPADNLNVNSSEPIVPNTILRYSFDVTEVPTKEDYNIVLQVVAILGSFLTIPYWMMAFWQFGVWALFFRQLFMIFYWKILSTRELGQFIKFPHEIRTFNRVVSVLDEYNKFTGAANVLGAIVLITYVSTSVKDAFSDFLNIFQLGAGLHLILSFVPLVVVAFWLADVQRVAGLFAGILKEEYGRFNHECGDPAESLCGITIVHHDLSMSNIGFKGLGFYTVSYQFIANIAGAIITYSIIVYQLSPRYNSIEP